MRRCPPVNICRKTSPQCTNLLAAASGPTHRRDAADAAANAAFDCAFGINPFTDKHLPPAPALHTKPSRRIRAQLRRDSSTSREERVDNAVSTNTDSDHTNFTASRPDRVRARDQHGLRFRRHDKRTEAALRRAPRNGKRIVRANARQPSGEHECRDMYQLPYLVLHQETKEGPALRCRRPATSASATGRRAPKRETRSHREGPRQPGRATASTPEHRLAPDAHVPTQRLANE